MRKNSKIIGFKINYINFLSTFYKINFMNTDITGIHSI